MATVAALAVPFWEVIRRSREGERVEEKTFDMSIFTTADRLKRQLWAMQKRFSGRERTTSRISKTLAHGSPGSECRAIFVKYGNKILYGIGHKLFLTYKTARESQEETIDKIKHKGLSAIFKSSAI